MQQATQMAIKAIVSTDQTIGESERNRIMLAMVNAGDPIIHTVGRVIKWDELAKRFGVTKFTARKMIKRYGLKRAFGGDGQTRSIGVYESELAKLESA